MKLRLYIDINRWDTPESLLYAHTKPPEKFGTATRYAFDIEVPDPHKPDVALPNPEPEEVKND